MKHTKGTHRHDFDTERVQALIAHDKLSYEDSLRILDDACHVIAGLRHDLSCLLHILDQQIRTRHYWISGKVDTPLEEL